MFMNPIEVSSLQEPSIWASDIVAGAFRNAFQFNDNQYIDALKYSYIEDDYNLYWLPL